MAFNPANKPLAISLNYIPRILACLLAMMLTYAVLWAEDRISIWAWIPVVFYGALGPHIAYFCTNNPKKEAFNILIDTTFYSYCLGLLGFQPFLMAMYISTSYLALISYGGKRFIIYGTLSQALGLLIGGWITGFYFRQQLELVPLLIGTAGLMVFQLNMGVVLNKIHESLSATKARLRYRQLELENINQVALAVNRDLDLDHVLNRIMQTIEKIYPFESLYVVNYIPECDLYRIIGAYGPAVSQFELDAFKELEMDPVKDANSIFVYGIQHNRNVIIPELTRQMVDRGDAMDKRLYHIKPSRSIAYFPVSIDNEVVAGVAFINYRKTFELDKQDEKRISEYLVHVGTALRNARMYQDATEAKDDAEQSEQAKSRFLANMSHEIRTPMTAILGYSEALLDKNLKASEREEFTQTVIRSGKHLLTIINDILDISKIESSKMEVESIECSLVAILSDVKAYAALNTKEKGLLYELEVEFPIPDKIISDPTRLKQILYNLTNNAIKFTEEGRITTRVAVAEDSIQFYVTDTGIGMDDEAKEKLFKAFSQGDSSTTRLYGGTGLGLYISKNLAQLMGGSLTLDSVKGMGTTFCLSLPLLDCESHTIETQQQLDQLIEQHLDHVQLVDIPLFKGKVLVAEDNLENQNLIRRLLSQAGVDVTLVENGKLACEQADINEFDLIFLDMQMPVMGGKEAAIQIRQSGILTPLIAFTANVMKHQVDAYKSIGFDQIIEKPISQTALFESLGRYLERQGAHQQSLKVLVVEDNKVNQTILSRMVEKLRPNTKVIVADDGKQALQAIRKQSVDVVFMDMEMPVMGGVEATEKARQEGFIMPIYMVTGNTDPEHIHLCEEAGATGHICKPVDKHALKSVLQGLLIDSH